MKNSTKSSARELETVWLTQKQMGELFEVKQATLSEHINNIISVSYTHLITETSRIRRVNILVVSFFFYAARRNFDSFIAILGMFGSVNNHFRIRISNLKQSMGAVSYTHLDVYKRQW